MRSHLTVFATAAAVVAAMLVPAFPAAAEDLPPTPTPSVEPVETPTPTPTPTSPVEPVETPTQTPTPTTTPTPSVEPVETPTPSSTPTATPTTTPTTVTYTGEFTELSSEPGATAPTSLVFATTDPVGYVNVSVASLPGGVAPNGQVSAALAVPAGVTLSADPAARILQLAQASGTSPLTVVSTRQGRQLRSVEQQSTASAVNVTPVTTATHKIFAVLVTPAYSGAPTTATVQQTVEKVGTAVAAANTYWSQQSSGQIGFTLAGTVPFYKSANACTQAASPALWTEAATKAAALGYEAGRNVHLALFLPSDAQCGGGIGLGSIGSSVNRGGVLWSMGTDAPMEKATLAHELGHNLSLGHASWADCSGTTINAGEYGTFGCTIRNYGDTVDVMGFGNAGYTGGALSSPQAIRSGIWAASAYDVAPVGTTSYTLQPVSGNSGKRAVVVQDDNGVNYFVEFRNFTDEDAQYQGLACSTSQCVGKVAGQAGVRIMRLEDTYYLGQPGDDSYMFSRRVGGTPSTKWLKDDVFWSKGTTGIKITVTALSSGQATVQIVKPDTTPYEDPELPDNTGDWVHIQPSLSYDGNQRVGDTWTAALGDFWTSQSYTFQWLRNGAAIDGATAQSYRLTPSDLGARINVLVTGTTPGHDTLTNIDRRPSNGGWGPIIAGVYQSDDPGTVAVISPFTADTAGWPSGTTFSAYQWYRGTTATSATTAIAGATAKTYTPTAADANQFLRVRVGATVPGYGITYRYSTATDYTIKGAGTFAVTATPKVGVALEAQNLLAFTANGGAVSPTFEYQWLRKVGTAAPVVIAGATAAAYTPVAADLGASLSLRTIASKAGFVSNTFTSTASPATLKGDQAVTGTAPSITPGAVALAASPIAQSIVDPTGVTATYQWFRNDVAIAGATAATYKVVPVTDAGKALKVTVTFARAGYNNVVQSSSAADYSIYASGSFDVSNDLGEKVGSTLTVSNPTALALGADITATSSRTYVWLRNSTAIPGATGQSYTLVAGDLGARITVRETISNTSYVPLVLTSSPSNPIGLGAIAGTKVGPNITRSDNPPVTPLTLTVTRAPSDITEPGVTVTAQWYRGATAIAGATSLVYKPVAADYTKTLSLRITVTKPGYSPVTLQSSELDYSLNTTGTATVVGTPAVGLVLGTNPIDYYEYPDGSVTPESFEYQWMRQVGTAAPVAIAGATASIYRLVAADFGAKITYRVTAKKSGYLPSILTSTSSAVVAKGELSGLLTVGIAEPAAQKLTAMPSGVSAPNGSIVYSYQWFRQVGAGAPVAIAGATLPTYALVAADYNTRTSVRVTASNLNYTSVVVTTTGRSYSVVPSTPLPEIVGNVALGQTVQVGTRSYSVDGGSVSVAPAYQWLRDGVAIPTATDPTYQIGSADLGKSLTVRVTPVFGGYQSVPATSLPTQKVGASSFDGWNTALSPVTIAPATNVLTAGSANITTPAPLTTTYQWLRDGVAIAGATGLSYALTALDYGKSVSVRVTTAKVGFTTVVKTSAGVDYSITKPSGPAISLSTSSPSMRVGATATVSGTTGYVAQGAGISPSFAYQWFRQTGTAAPVAIAGAVGASYDIQSVDYATKITARVTATSPGAIALVQTAAPTAPIAIGVLQGSFAAPVVSVDPVSGKLTAALAAGAVTTPAPTLTYVWTRQATTPGALPVAIAGATASAYQPTAADWDKLIAVKVTASKANTTGGPQTMVSAGVNYSVLATGAPTLGGAPVTGAILSVTLPTSVDWTGTELPRTLTYQWLRQTGTAAPVAIAGATAPTYELTTADFGTKTSVRVTATSPGYIANVQASASTALVAEGDLQGSFEGAQIVPNGNAGVKVQLPSGYVTTTATTITYQWFRKVGAAAPVAIAGATLPTFALTAADQPAANALSVKVTVKKARLLPAAGWTEAVAGADVGIRAEGLPTISGAVRVGAVVTVLPPVYSSAAGALTPAALAVQWLRGGVAIAGATATSYTPVAADLGTALSVRVTPSQPGLIGLAAVSAAQVVATGILEGSFEAPTVTRAATGLGVTVSSSSVSTPGVTFTYQWTRNGANIAAPLGTAAIYKPVAADFGATVSVKVVVSKAAFTARPLPESTPTSWSIVADAGPWMPAGQHVGQVITAPAVTFTLQGAPFVPTSIGYQWLRGGAVIAGATAASYTAVAADSGTSLSVRFTPAAPGAIGQLGTSAGTGEILPGEIVTNGASPVVTKPATTLVLTATVPAGVVTTPGVTYKYQWLRAGAPIAGATAATYTLVNSLPGPTTDNDKLVSVRVTAIKAGYSDRVLPESAGIDYTLQTTTPPVITGSSAVGSTLAITMPTYTTPPAGYAYQWFRNGTAIAGAVGTGATYKVVAADIGTGITVRVSAGKAGYLNAFRTSEPFSVTAP